MKGTVGPAMFDIDPALAERFRRVCPHWAEYILGLPSNTTTLQKHFKANGRDWYIVDGNSCIVGDAHRSNRHTCGACTVFSLELMGLDKRGAGAEKPWKVFLNQFLNHFEETHAK